MAWVFLLPTAARILHRLCKFRENEMCKAMDDLKAENKRLRVLLRAKDARIVAALGRIGHIERRCHALRRWLVPVVKGKNGE